MERNLPQMMHNFILIEPLNQSKKAGRIHIPDQALKSRARVVAVGPGKYLTTGTFIEMRVKPGDVVIMDGNHAHEFAMLYWGGTEFGVARDELVVCTIDPEAEPDEAKVVLADLQHPDLQ